MPPTNYDYYGPECQCDMSQPMGVQIVSDGVTQVSHELTNYYHRKGEINWEILLLLLCITSNNEGKTDKEEPVALLSIL